MNDDQLLRYSRQIMLPEIDAAGQEKLAAASVLIIGLGGLGSSSSIYLASAGVGRLVIVDHDEVDLSNLQRQIVHATSDIGRPKVDSAKETLASINPDTLITGINHRLDENELEEQVARADVVLDCSDNFDTRFAINTACVKNRTPLVSAAAIRFEAQFSVFDTRKEDSPCYRCLYGESASVEQNCTANGVIAPLLGVMGSLQALEAMKLIMGVGQTLTGSLLLLDAMTMEFHRAKLQRDPDCPTCKAWR
ncbi:MAG: molybdopterin-synthase adenylyltransferase MoeB [Gammaproteobacteria bacterium]|nr:molybdopterin-synthase adenylyltransferase MoeB [Gammaproteobacteria bacterium]